MSKISLAGTHLPVLSQLLMMTKGPVLEFGSGWNSTPLMYWTCKAQDRLFQSYENDLDWCKKMEGLTDYVPSWDSLRVPPIRWSIVFIDCRPAKERRELALRYKDHADYIVLHDSEPEINRFYGYTTLYKHFKYKYEYTKLKPNTLILSNSQPFLEI